MARCRHVALAAAVALLAVVAAAPEANAAPEAATAPSCTALYSTQLIKTEFAPNAHDAPTARPVPSSFVARGLVLIQSSTGAPLDSDARVTIDFGHGVELASQAEVAGNDAKAASAAAASAAPLFVPTESASPSVKSFAVVPPRKAESSSLEASTEAPSPPEAVALTYELSSPSTDFAPRGISVDGSPCAVASAGDAVPPSPPSDARSLRSPIPGLSFLEEKPVATLGDLFVGVDGLPFTIKGINWFGYENGQTNPDGLWGNVSDSIVADFVNVVWRMQLLGFNTVRLPFSFRFIEVFFFFCIFSISTLKFSLSSFPPPNNHKTTRPEKKKKKTSQGPRVRRPQGPQVRDVPQGDSGTHGRLRDASGRRCPGRGDDARPEEPDPCHPQLRGLQRLW